MDRIEKYIDAKVRDDGTIEGYDVNELNIDNVNAGKTLFEAYDKMTKRIMMIFICSLPMS